MVVGGASENTMLTAALTDRNLYDVSIVSGAESDGEGDLVAEARARGTAVYVIDDLRRDINPFRDLLALWRLYIYMRRGRFHLVHTHSAKAGVLGRLAAKLAAVPVIVHTYHALSFEDFRGNRAQRYIFLLLERTAAKVTDRFITVCEAYRRAAAEHGVAHPDKIVVIRSGFDLEPFRYSQSTPGLREKLGIPGGAKVVGSIGRLSKQKAPLDLVEIARAVIEKMPGAVFLMVGDGPERPAVEKRITELALEQHVKLLGIRNDVHELISLFDLLLVTSHWEGLPRVIPQAMAAGKPVVATDVGGTAEVVEDRITGFLSPPGSTDAMAKMILQLLDDQVLAERFGEAGRERVGEFCAERMAQCTEELYGELLSQKGLISSDGMRAEAAR